MRAVADHRTARAECKWLVRRKLGRVERADGNLVGTATGVDPSGRLLVTTDGGTTEAIAAGDVVHLRAVDPPT